MAVAIDRSRLTTEGMMVGTGDLDQATTHFEETLKVCRKTGYRPELAWACRAKSSRLLFLENKFDNILFSTRHRREGRSAIRRW